MTFTFEIGSALVVCALFIAVTLFPRHPIGSVAIAACTIVLLVIWANVVAGWDPATGGNGLMEDIWSGLGMSTETMVRTASTVALLGVSWWIAGFWYGDDLSDFERPLRGRAMRTGSGNRLQAAHANRPVRQYRST